MPKPYTVQDFFKQFPDDDACLDHLMATRYGRSLDCPKCGKHGKFHRIKKMPAYACQYCGHHIHPMAGTPFERTRTSLQSWFYAMYLFTTTRHGVPAKELQRQLGVTYKTAWRMAHEIRKYVGAVDGDGDLGGGVVEADETYVGGRPRVRGVSKPGRGTSKMAVFGMVQRGGEIITRVVQDCSGKSLHPLIEKHIKRGTVMSTDEWTAYNKLDRMGYQHIRCDHGAEQWVNGNAHTDTLEGIWSHFKCSVKGTHRAISRKHAQKYLVEFEFRFNRRASSRAMMDELLLAF